MKKSQHIVKHRKGWSVKKTGSSKATKVTRTQKEAIKIGKQIAKNQQTELVIHGQNGKIREKSETGGSDRRQ